MQPKAKSFLVLSGIFLAGVITGGSVAWTIAHKNPPRRPPRPDFVTRTLDTLAKEIGLKPEQRPEVEKIARETDEEMKTLRRDAMVAGGERIRAMHARIAVLLTPEQKTLLADFQKREDADRLSRMAGPPPSPAPGMVTTPPQSGRPASP